MKEAAITLFATIGLLVVIALIVALPVMLLWNWLMPTLFGLMKISFGQAVGLNLLCGCLFRTNVSINKGEN